MKAELCAIAKIHWYDPTNGGRKTLPSGEKYAATARFDDLSNDLVSIVLHFFTLEHSQDSQTAEVLPKQALTDISKALVCFLAPQLVKSKLNAGVKLFITEGPKTVAECEILEASQNRNYSEINLVVNPLMYAIAKAAIE